MVTHQGEVGFGDARVYVLVVDGLGFASLADVERHMGISVAGLFAEPWLAKQRPDDFAELLRPHELVTARGRIPMLHEGALAVIAWCVAEAELDGELPDDRRPLASFTRSMMRALTLSRARAIEAEAFARSAGGGTPGGIGRGASA